MTLRLRSGLLTGIALVFASTSFGDTMLDFGVVAPTTGSISYAGGINPLVGTAISVDNVVGLSTPLNSNVTLNCLGCFLNFTTGNLVSTSPNSWVFGGGGSITVAGTVDLNNNGVADAGDATGTLIDGNFGNNQPSIYMFGSTFKIAGAAFSNVQNTSLTNFYGLPLVPYTGNFNISFLAPGAPPSGFTSTSIASGDILNTVPEPVSIILLGTAVLGCATLMRKKLRQG